MIVLGIGAIAWTVLLWRYGGAGPGVELDAIRAAGTLIVGAGGFAALVLAARRQRSTELTLEHQREVALANERDAADRRLTELYTRAVDQLGAEKAPVRLGGLHALERLAQNNPDQRQTIVDVICAYLRMPYTPPDDQAPGEDAPEDAHRRHEQRRQELQVRLTAQRILTAHLRPEVEAAFWDEIDLNLAEAHLRQFDLNDCHVREAQFQRATFTGEAGFVDTGFAGGAVFSEAVFTETAHFSGAWFGGVVWFLNAKFIGDARFQRTRFASESLSWEAKFAKTVQFEDAQFAIDAELDRAQVASDSPHVDLPTGWSTRAARPAEGEEEGWLYVVRDAGSSEQPTEAPGHEEDPS